MWSAWICCPRDVLLGYAVSALTICRCKPHATSPDSLSISVLVSAMCAELAEGLHLIDFEQLKIENQTLNEKVLGPLG
jgi:hypothetical protein